MLNRYPKKSLLELFEGQSNVVIFVILFVFCEVPKNLCHLFGIYDQRCQLESKTKIVPGFKCYLRVVFLLSQRKVALTQEEIEQSSNRRLKLSINVLDILRCVQLIDLFYHLLPVFNSLLITLVNFSSQLTYQLLLFLFILLLFLHLFLFLFSLLIELFLKFVNLLLIKRFKVSLFLFLVLLFTFVLFLLILFLLFILLFLLLESFLLLL